MKPRLNPFVRSAVLATFFATLNATAATFVWDGNISGNDGNWATDTNWTGTPPDDANVTGGSPR